MAVFSRWDARSSVPAWARRGAAAWWVVGRGGRGGLALLPHMPCRRRAGECFGGRADGYWARYGARHGAAATARTAGRLDPDGDRDAIGAAGQPDPGQRARRVRRPLVAAAMSGGGHDDSSLFAAAGAGLAPGGEAFLCLCFFCLLLLLFAGFACGVPVRHGGRRRGRTTPGYGRLLSAAPGWNARMHLPAPSDSGDALAGLPAGAIASRRFTAWRLIVSRRTPRPDLSSPGNRDAPETACSLSSRRAAVVAPAWAMFCRPGQAPHFPGFQVLA